MAGSNKQQGFPTLARAVDEGGFFTQPWTYLLLYLWNTLGSGNVPSGAGLISTQSPGGVPLILEVSTSPFSFTATSLGMLSVGPAQYSTSPREIEAQSSMIELIRDAEPVLIGLGFATPLMAVGDTIRVTFSGSAPKVVFWPLLGLTQ